jgi:hypothetical protein
MGLDIDVLLFIPYLKRKYVLKVKEIFKENVFCISFGATEVDN